MNRHDWMPRREQDFADLCQKWIAVIEPDANRVAYGWEARGCTELLEKITAFLTARDAYASEDSSVKRLVKNRTMAAAQSAMRVFANANIRFNPKIPDAVKATLGITPRDTAPTPQPVPASQPETVVENTKNHYEHKLIALNPEGKTARKPADAHGLTYAWQLGGKPPESGEDLPKRRFCRKTDYTVRYSEAAKGTVAYYASRYENRKGDGGPWSPVVESYIG